MSKMKKLIVLLVTLTMVFASVVPVAALSDLNSTYRQGALSDTSAKTGDVK